MIAAFSSSPLRHRKPAPRVGQSQIMAPYQIRSAKITSKTTVMTCSPIGIGCLCIARVEAKRPRQGLGERTEAASGGAPVRRSAIHCIGKKWHFVLR